MGSPGVSRGRVTFPVVPNTPRRHRHEETPLRVAWRWVLPCHDRKCHSRYGHRAAACALVVHGRIRCSARTSPSTAADGTVKSSARRGESPPGDSGLRLLMPERRPAESDAQAGDSERPAAFVDIGQFVLVERVLAHAEAERIERAVPNIVTLHDRREGPSLRT